MAPIPSLTTMTTTLLPPLHLLAYSTLLGSTLYQTFLVTKITFQALPRSAFTTLQRKLFPAYFRCQAGLLALTALTVPAAIRGEYDGSLVMIWAPFIVAGLSSVLNLLVFGPGTQRVMVERIHQGEHPHPFFFLLMVCNKGADWKQKRGKAAGRL